MLAVAWGHDVLKDTDSPESAIRNIDDMLGERILSADAIMKSWRFVQENACKLKQEKNN